MADGGLPFTVHTTTMLKPIDFVVVDGFRTMSATRTIIDLAHARAHIRRVEAAIDSAVRLGLSSPEVLATRLETLRGSGRWGCRLVDQLIVDSGGHTMLERRFLEIVRRAGLPRPRTQVVHRKNGRHIARVDFLFDEAGVGRGGVGPARPLESGRTRSRRPAPQRAAGHRSARVRVHVGGRHGTTARSSPAPSSNASAWSPEVLRSSFASGFLRTCRRPIATQTWVGGHNRPGAHSHDEPNTIDRVCDGVGDRRRELRERRWGDLRPTDRDDDRNDDRRHDERGSDARLHHPEQRDQRRRDGRTAASPPDTGAPATTQAPPTTVARPDGPAADMSEMLTGGAGVFMGEPLTTDLDAAGYTEHEYVAAGTATSYTSSERTTDGRWTFTPEGEAPYRTRVLVRMPADPADFSGTVVLEWLNVSGGADANPEWAGIHEEVIRQGHAWVGVSAQMIGVMGGPVLVRTNSPGSENAGLGLRAIDPERYGTLDHPGDGFAFDIYTQVARAIRSGAGIDGLTPDVLVAAGESQSAFALVTYYNGVQPLTQAFDGFFVHSRGGVAMALVGPGESADLAGAIGGGGPSTFRDDQPAPRVRPPDRR